ncbi:endonuclease/exonuclease/phosphatase family protein [Microbacterium sp. 179-B 1A2 NHS]|uniref:endonuclease/exonuclease/phosphatase family protein n=1 Tax=Microbacterium sp. 179-B 1A2 NHS TaxID=3142383 RepID=UPI0039A1BDEF
MTPPERDDVRHLSVMSFNVRRPMPVLLSRPADRWSRRRPLLVEFLRRERPVLLGAQEVFPDPATAIRDALGPPYRMVGVGRREGGRGEGCPVFYDSDRLDLLESTQLALSDTPGVAGSRSWGNPMPRAVVVATFCDRVTGVRFTHLNTHLDPFSAASRVRSVVALRERVADLEHAAIVTGDLNAAEGSPALRELLRDRRLVDAWDAAADRSTPAWGTYGGYRSPVAGGPRIDWIAVTPSVRVHRAAIDPRPIRGRWPSDHLPVTASVEMPR